MKFDDNFQQELSSSHRQKKTHRFQFVLDELWPLQPIVKQAFGMVFVYSQKRLMLALRDSAKQPDTNGVWLFIEATDIPSLRKEFPSLSGHYFWRSGENAWVIIPSKRGDFESLVMHACELILSGDRRIGRVSSKFN